MIQGSFRGVLPGVDAYVDQADADQLRSDVAELAYLVLVADDLLFKLARDRRFGHDKTDWRFHSGMLLDRIAAADGQEG